MLRRNFIRQMAVGGIIIANGQIFARNFNPFANDVEFRFSVASDGHYGQPDTDYEEYFETIVKKINYYHALFPSEFVVFNGDIIHDEPQFLTPAHKALSKVKLPLYATKGNHDKVTPEVWENTWGFPQNHDFTIGERSVLLGTTSDVEGTYLCPDMDWFSARLDEYKSAREIYIFLHITPNDWTDHGVSCPEFHDLLKKYPNVTAAFNGHDHHEDGIKTEGKVPFMFDGHFGGSWGTEYRGFRVVEKLKNGTMRTYLMNPDDQYQVKEM
ncbi:metallophosphoesterase family protein [Membranihabitans maritimus]|uniref:metallophosphoesterase family protein n=1 Tax=Membranihabitans maritimus TaxID=2904244 RepID=UPI001F26287E|nr:metallophosphoesterase [Membranihabitans maritimus]